MRRIKAAHIILVLIGIIVGMVLDAGVKTVEAQNTPKPPVQLFVTHPTTGRAIPVSATAEGYINVKVIP